MAAVERGTAEPIQGADGIPALYDLALAMYAGDADRLYRQLSALRDARGGGAGPEERPEPVPAPEERPGPAPAPVPELPVDYLSILDLGYGPMSASRLRELIELGKVEQYVEDGRLRFRRVTRTADKHPGAPYPPR